ncbi:hypothetical protein HXX76_006209 [Chlamydomonas incerta]|uniref:Protein kinase domain-containing protein n=1 Tax=Chlamydomonas incerta TaxID=51695 RepID=A0A835T3I6_CHLIN|nr:hypothetical protein HXX76_006209 [Chlamydomonas incerta]|eukprot:KAG2436681.1 hypothetical protein HXX76_006209 [Chlamydomonas incerta]
MNRPVDVAREFESVERDIAKTTSDIDKVEKEIEKKQARQDHLVSHLEKIRQELNDVQAQLLAPALNEEDRARLRLVEQQLCDEQQLCRDELVDARKKEEQLRNKEEQLRNKEEQLRSEKAQLRKEKEQLRLLEQAQPNAGGADLVRSQLQAQLDALPSPLDMAHSKVWSQHHDFFQCFRPADGKGPTRALPIALYDAVLDQLVAMFHAAMRGVGSDGGSSGISSSSGGGSSGGGADDVAPSQTDFVLARRLCETMARSFGNETERMDEFTALLEGYLGEPIDAHHPIRTEKFETDGSLRCCVGTGPAASMWLPVYIQEVKNEIGKSGDPYFQGQRYYQCYVADPKLAAQVRHTVLPALMLELAGPHLRVSALASPRDVTVVCEPLTPYLHLFSMERCDPDHMDRLALVLRAIKDGFGLLKDSCRRLVQQPQPPAASPTAECSASAASALALASPSASEEQVQKKARRGVVPPVRDLSLQLPYPLRPGTGFTDVRAIGPGVYKPLYSAKHGGRAVAVKFTRMSPDAVRVQRAWAAAGLAPALVLEEARPLPCGMTMLVMEWLAAEDGWVMFWSLPPDQKRRLHGEVVAALRRAHEVMVDDGRGGRLPGVHADLRQANVMVRGAAAAASGSSGCTGGSGEAGSGAGGSSISGGAQVQVQFVDFEWAGLQGRTRLPRSICQRLPGYGSGCQVTQEYDWALWEHERVQGPL